MKDVRQKLVAAALLMIWNSSIDAADVAAGRAVAEAKCVQCHEADDWDGEGAALLEGIMRDIVAGRVKHKTTLDLTPAEIANIAAYWGAGKR